jgi:hypothetical protein
MDTFGALVDVSVGLVLGDSGRTNAIVGYFVGL